MSRQNSQSGSKHASRQSSRHESVHEDEHEDKASDNSSVQDRMEAYEEMLQSMQNDPMGQILSKLIHGYNELAAAKKSKGKSEGQAETINVYHIAEKLAEANQTRQYKTLEQEETIKKLQEELQALSITTEDQMAKTAALEALSTEMQEHKDRGWLADMAENYNNPVFRNAVVPPTNFPDEKKINNSAKLLEACKLFPKGGGRFTGEKNSPINVNEFLTTMNEVQEFLQLTEKEFKNRVLGSTTGRAHELISYWIEQGYPVSKIYYQLHLNFNKQDTPFAARQKLQNFKAYKNKGSAETEATIAQLALKAVQTIPYGAGRDSYFDHLCATTYIDSLPKETSKFVRRRYNDLAMQLKRQPTFSELSQSLDAHRMDLDTDLSQNGAQPKGKEKEQTDKKSNNKKGTKYVNVLQTDKTNSEEKDKKFKGKQKNDKNQKTDKNQKKFNGKKNQKNVKNRSEKKSDEDGKKKQPAPQRKPYKSDKYCPLCGNTTHNATDGCFKMRDAEGNILEVTPCYGDCTLCNRGLKHPEELCPYVHLVQAAGQE